MNQNPLVSVIMPVYNGGIYLKEAIESILNQTFTDFEFIILDDGSTDNSLKLIKHYANIDNRIIIISRENKGLVYTLNEGIEKSKGRYIARMDADDISTEDRLQVQYDYMQEHDFDICGGNYTIINEFGKEGKLYKLFQSDFEILLTMASNVPFPHPSVMIKKDFLKHSCLKYGLDGSKQAEDLDLWLNIYKHGGKFSNVNMTILKYRILSTSLSRVNHKKIMKESNEQFDLFIKTYKNDFIKAFEIFFSKENNSYELEKVVVKAALRYAIVHGSVSILSKCIKKVSIKSFCIGTLSFVKMKTSISI